MLLRGRLGILCCHSAHDAGDEYLCQDMQMSCLMTTSDIDDRELRFRRTFDIRFRYRAVDVSSLDSDSDTEKMLLEGACCGSR